MAEWLKKTVDTRGVTQVQIVSPAGAKIAHTVALLVRGNGEKLKAIIVFKTACKDFKTFEKSIHKKLKIPANVVVKGSASGWWNAALDAELMKELFPKAANDENHEHTATKKAGNMANPTKQDFVNWISEAWDHITPELIRKSFSDAFWKHIEREK